MGTNDYGEKSSVELVLSILARLEQKIELADAKLAEIKDSFAKQLTDVSNRLFKEEVWHSEMEKQRDYWTSKAWPDHMELDMDTAERVSALEHRISMLTNLDKLIERVDGLEKWKSKATGAIAVLVFLLGLLEVAVNFLK